MSSYNKRNYNKNGSSPNKNGSSSNKRNYQKPGQRNKTPYNKRNYQKSGQRNRNNRQNGFMVRISNLPHDIDEQELSNLVKFEYTGPDEKTFRCNWYILKCFIMKNRYGYTGMISFKFKNQAEYVVESLNKTTFVNQILKVELLPPR
jgi:hypothetical protein